MASPAELMVSHNLGGGVPRRATWSHPARGRASPAPSLRPALAPRSPRAWWAAALAWALSCAVLLLTQSGVPLLCSLACVSATALAARAGAGPRRKPRPVKFATQIRPRNLRPLVPRAAPPSLRPAASGEAAAGDAAAARQQLLPAVAALERYEAAAAPPTAAVEGLDAAAVAAALDGVDARVRDEQWLDAAIELRALDAACEQLPRNHPAAAAMAAAAAADAGRAQPLESVRARGREIGSALRELGSADGWEFATETHGASTYHKRDASGRLWLKTDGVMRGVGCLEVRRPTPHA